jgi:CubicO group peptidase (beta-lactamase class C family)
MARRDAFATAFPCIAAICRDFREQRRLPGVAVGVVIDGELTFADGFGVANAASAAPVTPTTVFRIASMTKSFTAMAIIRLRDAGKLRLDDPAVNYVPELAALHYPTRDSAPITVRDLLTMGAGLPQDDPWADRQLAASDEQLSAWLRGGLSFSNPPGVTFEYSNYGYAILGRIVSIVAGMPYQAYITQHILHPLGMTDSTFDMREVAPERLAMGYRADGDQWIEEPPLADGTFGAMGGLFTTITDFSRYMAFLMSAFPPRDDDDAAIPIRRSSAREMQQMWRHVGMNSSRTTPDAVTAVQGASYGFGLSCAIDSTFGYSVSHGGGLPGYGTYYRLLPDFGVGVVVLTNLTYVPAALCVNDALHALRDTGALTPRKPPLTPLLVSVRDSILRLYAGWDDATARATATESFFQDMPIDKRQAQFERLFADLGACLSVTEIEPENALRGRWVMHCERGRLEVFATCSPTVPPRLQYLQLIVAKAPNEPLAEAIAQMARLIAAWDEGVFVAFADAALTPDAVRSQLEALRVVYGRLQAGEVLEGDGETFARVRFTSGRERGMIDVRVALNVESGKVREISFSRPRETAFVP